MAAKPKTSPEDIATVRAVLRALRPAAAAKAADPPPVETIYTPDSHEKALDPERALVIGNRGVGKSFWASVLADPTTRASAAESYRRLPLSQTEVTLGFHEAAGKVEGPAPSPEQLKALLAEGYTPEAIWRAVLLRALGPYTGLELPHSLNTLLSWSTNHLEQVESGLRRADALWQTEGRRFVLLFDALDRLGSDWETIRPLTAGLLRFALDIRGFRALRVKLFMRTDQSRDERLFQFPDSSKLRAESVELEWRRKDLYGLLYRHLWHSDGRRAFRTLVTQTLSSVPGKEGFPSALKNDEEAQEAVLIAMASRYMGSNQRRGKTYTWLHGHLADAFRETSPRSFLIALQRAATSMKEDASTILDHEAIREGVREASKVRVNELAEDFGWILPVFAALEKLEVPCPPKSFIERWKKQGTVSAIRDLVRRTKQLGPLELADQPRNTEEALISALQNVGIVERREDDKINMPDIFRIAAKMKRRGGVTLAKKR